MRTTSGLTKAAAAAGSLLAIGALATGIGKIVVWADVTPVLSRDFKQSEASAAASVDKLKADTTAQFIVVQNTIDQMSKANLYIEWKVLKAQLDQNGHLEFADEQRFCFISGELKFKHIPLCGL